MSFGSYQAVAGLRISPNYPFVDLKGLEAGLAKQLCSGERFFYTTNKNNTKLPTYKYSVSAVAGKDMMSSSSNYNTTYNNIKVQIQIISNCAEPLCP